MCFTCGPVMSVQQPGFSVLFTRIADEITRPSDFDLSDEDISAWEDGQWYYVGMSATLMVGNRPILTETLHGIPEREASPCAFANELATGWLLGEVLTRSADVLVATDSGLQFL